MPAISPGWALTHTGTRPMKTFICVILLLSITACATCKSSDSYEVCRTKQRDHSQARP